MKQVYYHVAPVVARDQIMRQGITPWDESRDTVFPQFEPKPVVHLWKDIKHAHEWADAFADMYPDPSEDEFPDEAFAGNLPVADIWQITPDFDLNVRPDNRVDGGYTTEQSIPPEAIQLIDTYSISDMSKYRDAECPSCGSEWDWERDACPECDPPESRIESKVASGFVPPEAAQQSAAKGLQLVEQGEAGDGLEPATVDRARLIAAGQPLTSDHVQRMHSFFERHDKTRPDDGGKGNSPWRTAWELWGGDAGREWAHQVFHTSIKKEKAES